MEPVRTWKVSLFGRFELRSPDGFVVVLPTRRTEALIANLVVNRRRGVSREELVDALWPHAPDTLRRASLRQALSLIRKACPDLLDIQGQRCRLSESCKVESDYDGSLPRAGELFMPGMEGEWFDAMRLEEEPDPTIGLSKPSPSGGFFQMLTWLSENDPSKTLSLMRECPALFEGLDGEEGRQVVSRLPASNKLAGWRDYFEGRVVLNASIPRTEYLMRKAAFEASKHSDQKLLVYSLKELLTIATLSNKLDDAHAISARLTEAAARRKTEFGPSANYVGRALLSLHSGLEKEGLQLLAIAQDASPDALDAANVQSLRAFFCSTYGRFEEAEMLLVHPTRVSQESGHGYIKSVCELTRVIMTVKQADGDEVDDRLNSASSKADTIDNQHFKIYVKESVAMRYLQAGNLSRAGRAATEVRKLRRGLSMAYTPWDKMRLAP